jgi:RluA family pseudouridine synthase
LNRHNAKIKRPAAETTSAEDTATKTFVLTVDERGERLDRYVAMAMAADASMPDLSRTAVQRLIEEGKVTVNNVSTRSSHKLQANDTIVVHIPPPEPTELKPQALPLNILYEDEDIIVVNKAAGMVVHPGAGHPDGTLVNAVLAHCPDLKGVGGERRPGIVHRLDKDTSGVIVLAKHDHAIRQLQQQFKRRTIRKTYIALVIGKLAPEEGIIDAPIGRHPRHRKRMAVVPQGRASYSRWKVIKYLARSFDYAQDDTAARGSFDDAQDDTAARGSFDYAQDDTAARGSFDDAQDDTAARGSFDDAQDDTAACGSFDDAQDDAAALGSFDYAQDDGHAVGQTVSLSDTSIYTLIQVRPKTGRTHQIRVHLSWLGYPVVGDRKYGPSHPPIAAPRQFLHARQLKLTHPETEETMTFTAPLPTDLEAILDELHPLT